jgi:hypothetical protein
MVGREETMKKVIIMIFVIFISVIINADPLVAIVEPAVASLIVAVGAAMGLSAEQLSDSFIDGAYENMKNYITSRGITAYAAAMGIIDNLKQLGENVIDYLDTDIIVPIAVNVVNTFDTGSETEQEWLASQVAGYEINMIYDYASIGGMPEWAQDLVGHNAYYMTSKRVTNGTVTWVYAFNYVNKPGGESLLYGLSDRTTYAWKNIYTDGEKWYKLDNYVVTVLNDWEFAQLWAAGDITINYYITSSGTVQNCSFRDMLNNALSTGEHLDTVKSYVCNYLAVVRRAIKWRADGIPEDFYVKKLASIIKNGIDTTQLKIPVSVELPITSSQDDSDMWDWADNVRSSDENIQAYRDDPDVTVSDQSISSLTGSDVTVSAPVGSIRYENGYAVAWEIAETDIASITQYGDVMVGNTKIGCFVDGSISLNFPQDDYSTYYMLGNMLVFTRNGDTIYAGDTPILQVEGSDVKAISGEIVGYVVSDGLHIGSQFLTAENGLPAEVTTYIDIEALQSQLQALSDDISNLSNQLAGTASDITTIKTIVNCNNSLAQTIRNTTDVINTKLDNLDVSVDLGTMPQDITDIKSDLANLQASIDAIQTTDLTNVEQGITSIDEKLTDVQDTAIKQSDLIDDINADVETSSFWKKLFWFDTDAIMNAVNDLKVTAESRAPFAYYANIQDLLSNITIDGSGDLPEIEIYGVKPVNMDHGLTEQLRQLVRGASTWVFWLMFIGMIIKVLLPKVAIS